jgi:hypothetical protein
MKNDKGPVTSAAWKRILFSVLLSAANDAAGQLPFQSTQWIEPDPPAVQKVLTQINFDQYSSGAYNLAVSDSWAYMHSSVPAAVPVNTASISGPGIVGIGPASGFGTNQSALFTGFGDNGGTGYINFSSKIVEASYFDGLSFDIYSGELPGGLHGPTSFYVQISNRDDASYFDILWQSELVQLVPGTANAIHWDISNPDGNDANGDGIAVTNGLPSSGDWRSIRSYGDLDVRIVANGANTSLTGLGVDNIQITGVSMALVPEPSSCLLLVLGMFMIGGRSRRSGRA